MCCHTQKSRSIQMTWMSNDSLRVRNFITMVTGVGMLMDFICYVRCCKWGDFVRSYITMWQMFPSLLMSLPCISCRTYACSRHCAAPTYTFTISLGRLFCFVCTFSLNEKIVVLRSNYRTADFTLISLYDGLRVETLETCEKLVRHKSAKVRILYYTKYP
jgi:hypothetical protein